MFNWLFIDENMHGRKLTLNEMDKEKINYRVNS